MPVNFTLEKWRQEDYEFKDRCGLHALLIQDITTKTSICSIKQILDFSCTYEACTLYSFKILRIINFIFYR